MPSKKVFIKIQTMNAYEIHKALINTYVLQRKGDTSILKRDTSKDKRDIDVLRENHKFLWDSQIPKSWEEQLAKRYYDKLFKEFTICDLKYFKHNKVALRWRIEKEVVTGKGQFSCADKNCSNKDGLRTWEVNFGYIEDNIKKNVLVKLKLCADCSKKLNYHSQKREIKRLKKSKDTSHKKKNQEEGTSSKNAELDKNESITDIEEKEEDTLNDPEKISKEPWIGPIETNEKTREEEIDDYLTNLFF